MVLLLPQEGRHEPVEKIIAVSLTDFFTGPFRFYSDKCREKLHKSILLFVAGVIIMLINAWVSYYSAESFPIIFLKVLPEPAGWFLVWALDFWFYDFAELKIQRNFYIEISETHIHFKSSWNQAIMCIDQYQEFCWWKSLAMLSGNYTFTNDKLIKKHPVKNILNNNKQIKTGVIPKFNLKQLQNESDSWKKLLGFMMDENISLKNRLSEVLKDKFDKNLLAEAEGFQSRFIKEDQLVSLLRNDIVELDKLLSKDIVEEKKIINETGRRLKNLRNNVTNAENQFYKLKLEFKNYLSENVQYGWKL